MKEVDNIGVDSIICPWCGTEEDSEPSIELYEDGEVTVCCECMKEFQVFWDIKYTTRKIYKKN